MTIRRYPVSGHATEPKRCSRCAARVFDYSTENHTINGKMIERHHYCPPCDRFREAARIAYRETMVRNDAFGEAPF